MTATLTAPAHGEQRFGPFTVFFAKEKWRVKVCNQIRFSHSEEQAAIKFATEMAATHDAAGGYILTDADREQHRLACIRFDEAVARSRARRLAAKNVRRRA